MTAIFGWSGRRLGASVASIALTLSSLTSAAAQAPSKARVGYLSSAHPSEARRDVIRQGLRERGWVEGDNLVLEWREAEGNLERLPELTADLLRLKVDVIVTAAAPATAAAQKATSSVPIVFVVGDAVGSGFVASFARPGGNLTGFDVLSSELTVKRLELLRETFPKVTSVAVLYEPDSAMHPVFVKELEQAARTFAIQVRRVAVRSPRDIDQAAAVIARERVHALFIIPSPFFTTERRRLVNLASSVRLPAIYDQRDYVEIGGLMSYGPNFQDVFRRATLLVDRILRGAKPADLPVEHPTKFELVVNERTMKSQGLTLAPSVLLRADEIIH